MTRKRFFDEHQRAEDPEDDEAAKSPDRFQGLLPQVPENEIPELGNERRQRLIFAGLGHPLLRSDQT